MGIVQMSELQKETQYFFELTPERILNSVERSGVRCTGRVLQLNSMENRVFEIEIEVEDDSLPLSASERFLIAKFYRPGRWSEEQILAEHAFLCELRDEELPVIAPVAFADGKTLHRDPELGIFYALFPKRGGRLSDELSEEQLQILGRLLARVHLVGARKPAAARLTMNPTVFGLENLQVILAANALPPEVRERYERAVNRLCQNIDPLFTGVPLQRIHGDCHLGNILWGSAGPALVDFDDMVMGPCVQDLWLIVPGRDEYARNQRLTLISAYEDFRAFDWSWVRLIEPLRALRYIHFSAWITKRWEDPAFKRVFVNFGTSRYWEEQVRDLEEQLALIAEA